jgi:replicative DNA helicase
MGSTAFAMNIAVNAAINQNAIVGIFSLGINKLSLLKRTLSSQARVHIRRLVTGFLSQDDLDKVEIAMEVLNATRISIDDTASITLAELRARATQLRKDQNGLDLIIVDALHLMSSTTLSTGHGADENRTQDLSAISCGLRALAKELNVPVIAVLPLPIMSRPNGDWRPILNDLRVYGSIERDADVVIFIHREECFQCDEEMSETGSSKVEAILAKYHNGPTCTFYLNFIPGYIRFRDLEQTADALREA